MRPGSGRHRKTPDTRALRGHREPQCRQREQEQGQNGRVSRENARQHEAQGGEQEHPARDPPEDGLLEGGPVDSRSALAHARARPDAAVPPAKFPCLGGIPTRLRTCLRGRRGLRCRERPGRRFVRRPLRSIPPTDAPGVSASYQPGAAFMTSSPLECPRPYRSLPASVTKRVSARARPTTRGTRPPAR